MIHCTADPDQKACCVEKIVYSSLYREGAVVFVRPSIPALMDKNTDEILDTPNQAASRTLLAYCGFGILANTVTETQVLNDVLVSMIGELSHTVELSLLI